MVGVQHQNNAINLVKQQKKQYLTEFSKKKTVSVRINMLPSSLPVDVNWSLFLGLLLWNE